MPRSRRTKPELSESWDAIPDELDAESASSEDGDSYENRTVEERIRVGRQIEDRARSDRRDAARGTPRTRAARSSVEPELVMPSPPDSGGANAVTKKDRAKTPHFRLNERSFTSDAGFFKTNGASSSAEMKQRTKTPRLRMNDRSMTSDAGQFKRGYAALAGEDEEDEDDTPAAYVRAIWRRVLRPILIYVGDIVGLILGNAKPLIAFALFAYLLGAAIVLGTGFLTNTVNNALSPICRIPGVTYFFSPPFCPISPVGAVEGGPAEFNKLVQAQSQFEDVLAASSTGASLPMDMKRSEAGIRDLKQVVQYSTLSSRNELVYEFNGFIETARQASGDLSKFNSRIGRAVDQILSTNRWTLSVIDGIGATESHRGSVAKFFANNLNIFAPFQPVSLSRDVLLDQYLRHTGAVEEQIAHLIEEAQALLGVLENLDGRLDVIGDIATRDGFKAQGNKDELFEYLWTKIGGNRSSVKKLNNQLQLLRDVGSYRRIAWAHVTSTIVKLQAIRNNLEDLRERVALPETVGTEVVPLEVHIDAINLGIERLEEQRDSTRKTEAEMYNRVLERAENGEGRMIGGSERDL